MQIQYSDSIFSFRGGERSRGGEQRVGEGSNEQGRGLTLGLPPAVA